MIAGSILLTMLVAENPTALRSLNQFTSYLAEGFDCQDILAVVLSPPDANLWGNEMLLNHARSFMDRAPAGIIVARQSPQVTAPAQFQQLLLSRGFKVPFAGWAPADESGEQQSTMVAVLENNHNPPRDPDPAGFRVVALMPVYNEADIIRCSLEYLIGQGIDVYLVDNWSTDGTFEIAQSFLGKGLIGLERFPASGPVPTYEWRSILARIESLTQELEADWFLLHDADERRQSPWRELSLKAGLHHVDRLGFNCVDHIVMNYSPVDDTFDPAHDVESQLRYFSFSDHPGHYHQRKAWKNPHCPVSLASTAGHDIRFPNRTVYPFKFLMKHYPIRSQSHGERKVLAERESRWNQEERALGWHKQYDDVKESRNFLGDPATLLYADDATFHEQYLFERLSGIGVFDEAPFWATGARQAF